MQCLNGSIFLCCPICNYVRGSCPLALRMICISFPNYVYLLWPLCLCLWMFCFDTWRTSTVNCSGGIGGNSRVTSPCGNLDVACAKNLPLHVPMVLTNSNGSKSPMGHLRWDRINGVDRAVSTDSRLAGSHYSECRNPPKLVCAPIW